MSLEDEKDGDHRRKSARHPENENSDKLAPAKKKRSSVPEVGGALRTVYQRTVDERIPPEMLDLLGKLG